MRRLFVIAALWACLCQPVFALPPEIRQTLPGAQLAGQTKARWLALQIYRAALWLPDPSGFSFGRPFALTLEYTFGFSAATLARSSIEEMARMEGVPVARFAALERQLLQCFANVDKGDRITGLAVGQNKALFFVNGVQSCALRFPNLRERFFGIWLGPGTRDPKGAARLTGRT